MKNPTCPKCGNQKNIQTTWIPLGHGRYCRYACPRCRILFEWGENKFGNIASVKAVTRYKELQENEEIDDVSKGKGDWKKIKESERLDNVMKKQNEVLKNYFN